MQTLKMKFGGATSSSWIALAGMGPSLCSFACFSISGRISSGERTKALRACQSGASRNASSAAWASAASDEGGAGGAWIPWPVSSKVGAGAASGLAGAGGGAGGRAAVGSTMFGLRSLAK